MKQLPPRRDYVNYIDVEAVNKDALDQATQGIRDLLRSATG